MADAGALQIKLDLSAMRMVGMSKEMFGLLLQIVQDADVSVRPEWLADARRCVETVLGRRLTSDVSAGADVTE